MKHINKWLSRVVLFTLKCLSRIALFTLLCKSIFANFYGKALNFSPEAYGSFTPENTYSYDGKFLAHQQVERGIGLNDLTKGVYIEIRDARTGALLTRFSPARAFDFWGICWENDSYNLWTQSADRGICCYRYENGQWKYDDSHPLQPDYIVSKYDK